MLTYFHKYTLTYKNKTHNITRVLGQCDEAIHLQGIENTYKAASNEIHFYCNSCGVVVD